MLPGLNGNRRVEGWFLGISTFSPRKLCVRIKAIKMVVKFGK
jgi:hypothetical protein